VIKYLEPTLDKHKGCTLIDFFPGSAIFSSKLHQFLKPRSHILIEPEGFFHEPFLKPLLDEPHSTYRHVTLSGNGAKTQWFRFRKTYSKIIPEVPKVNDPRESSEFDEINPNVLVIGNASRMCKLGGKFNGDNPFGLGVLRDLSSDSLSHWLFNRYGPVRMLWWVPERYKPSIIPPNLVYSRSSLNARIEMAYKVSEVAGVQSTATIKSARRSDFTERERSDVFTSLNHQAVAERMHEAGLTLPPGRKALSVNQSKTKQDPSGESLSPLENTAQSIDALREQIDKTGGRLDELSRWISSPKLPSKRASGALEALNSALSSIRYPQCIRGKEGFPHMKAKFVNNERFIILADISLRLANIEAGYMNLIDMGMTEEEHESVLSSLQTLTLAFRGLIGGDKSMPGLIDDFVEDQLTFYSSTPALSLERRAYEPLQAATSDFYPTHDMALIDFVPRGTNLVVPDLAGRQECTTFLKDLLKHLFATKSRSVPEALDRAIGINAGKDLVAMVPAITDIRKGGRLDPNDLKVRALTPEMIEGLVKAFFEWPFKPENWQLMLGRGTTADDGEEVKSAAEE
jgi:mitochondrial transcription factor 1